MRFISPVASNPDRSLVLHLMTLDLGLDLGLDLDLDSGFGCLVALQYSSNVFLKREFSVDMTPIFL